MASASSSYYNSFLFALLCMCIHLSAGAFLVEVAQGNLPNSHPPDEQNPKTGTPPAGSVKLNRTSPAPSPIYAPGQAPSPSSPSPAPPRSLAPAPASAPTPLPRSSNDSSESAKRRRARTLGLVLVSFAGVLQAFVVLFLFVKRRQMLKHVYGSHDHRTPPHIWANA